MPSFKLSDFMEGSNLQLDLLKKIEQIQSIVLSTPQHHKHFFKALLTQISFINEMSINENLRQKVLELQELLLAWKDGDLVLGDPTISTTITLLDVFIKKLREYEQHPDLLMRDYNKKRGLFKK